MLLFTFLYFILEESHLVFGNTWWYPWELSFCINYLELFCLNKLPILLRLFILSFIHNCRDSWIFVVYFGVIIYYYSHLICCSNSSMAIGSSPRWLLCHLDISHALTFWHCKMLQTYFADFLSQVLESASSLRAWCLWLEDGMLGDQDTAPSVLTLLGCHCFQTLSADKTRKYMDTLTSLYAYIYKCFYM